MRASEHDRRRLIAKRLFGISFISDALENEDDTVETRIGPENARC
jgi:hypothetical protein